MERITVDGQMSTNDTVLLQADRHRRGAAAGRACSTRCFCSSPSRSSPTARVRPGSAEWRSQRRRRMRLRPSASPGRSRNFSTRGKDGFSLRPGPETGEGSRRPAGMAPRGRGARGARARSHRGLGARQPTSPEAELSVSLGRGSGRRTCPSSAISPPGYGGAQLRLQPHDLQRRGPSSRRWPYIRQFPRGARS